MGRLLTSRLQGGKAQKHRAGNRLPGFRVTSTSHWAGAGATEGFVDYIRARREVRHALVISDPQPVDSLPNMWASVGQAATIGIFLLLFGTFLYIGHAILLPILAAAVVALTLAPL